MSAQAEPSAAALDEAGSERLRAKRLADDRKRRRALQTLAIRIVSVTAVLALWQFVGSGIDPVLFTTPLAIARAAYAMIVSGELWSYLWPSLIIFAVGLTIAALVGVATGLLLARFWVLDVALGVYITFLYSIPAVALVPLIVLWAGFESTAKIIVLFLFAFFPMAINTYQGVKNVDPRLIEVGHSFRCSERQLWANIVLPGALPFIVTGLRLAVGRGLIGMVLADQYTAISGIGYLIVRTAATYQVDKMFVPIVTLGILGITLTALLRVLERRVAPWTSRASRIDRALARAMLAARAEEKSEECMRRPLAAVLAIALVPLLPSPASAQTCAAMRKINVGIAVAPPNVVHTAPFVAKALGLFAKHCVEANIIQFDGGAAGTSVTAVAQGTAISNLPDVAIARGLKGKQIWGLGLRLPQAYVVPAEVKTAADLKGKRLSAAGGVGGFNWLMGREILRTANLGQDDAQFISQGTAGRLPGFLAGQIEGVALHPEDVFLVQQKKPGSRILTQLSDLLPNYAFNHYGASDAMIAKDRALLVDTIAAMIEANRAIYKDREKVLPAIVEATQKAKEAVEYALDVLTKNCILSVNEGFVRVRTEWTHQNNINVGDLEPEKKLTFEQIADLKLASDAVEKAGGRQTIGNCKD